VNLNVLIEVPEYEMIRLQIYKRGKISHFYQMAGGSCKTGGDGDQRKIFMISIKSYTYNEYDNIRIERKRVSKPTRAKCDVI